MDKSARSLSRTVLAAALVGACASAGAAPSGTVREKLLIMPTERITVVWHIGQFKDDKVNQVLRESGARNWPYELCTDYLFEQTFKQNGYLATAIQARPGGPPIPPDSRYVLVLKNVKAHAFLPRELRSFTPGKPNLVALDVEGALHESPTRRVLWTATHYISSEARLNSHSALHFVQALAADGYLNLKPEEVADYRGERGGSSIDVVGECPPP